MTETEYKEKFPSIPLGYDIGLRLIDGQEKRLDVMEGRSNLILTIMTTLNVSVVTIACTRLKGIGFDSGWFYLAMVLFLASFVLLALPRFISSIKVLDMGMVTGKMLHFQEYEFKWTIASAIKKILHHNSTLNNRTANLITISLFCFLAETVSLAAWVAVSASQQLPLPQIQQLTH